MNCNFGDIFNDLSYFGKNTILQSLLLAEDRMSMAHSLEARVPWVDYRLMDLAFQIPSYIKLDSKDDNKAKYFSRDSLKGLVPDFIIDRKKSPLSHPPKEYKNIVYENLIVPNHLEILKSKLLNEVFTKEFLKNLILDRSLTMNDLFKIYSLWRFEKIFL